jgi:hypothetical protein
MYEYNAFATLRQITSGYILSRCLHVVADFGVADVLDETPRTAAELAALVDAHPGNLGRVMALLATHGVFAMQGDRFCHSPASRLLISDHPHTVRAFVRGFGSPLDWQTYALLDYTVRTGKPALEKVAPEGQWAYRAGNAEENALFNAAMAEKARAQIAGILAVYDFSALDTVADLGGGLGHLVRAIVESTPGVQGILFDLPHVIEQADPGPSGRLMLQAGDFFADALPACDAYLLMEVIHDWDDPQATAILQAVRKAAPPRARLLLIETLLPDQPAPDWPWVVDVHMMTMLGGIQRTVGQYEILLNAGGFALQRVIDTGADISILEAVPA